MEFNHRNRRKGKQIHFMGDIQAKQQSCYPSEVINCKSTLPVNLYKKKCRFEMRGFNVILGSHYDHYYLTYDEFDNSPIDQGVFEIESGLLSLLLCLPKLTNFNSSRFNLQRFSRTWRPTYCHIQPDGRIY